MATEVIQRLNRSVRAAARQSARNVPFSFTPAASSSSPRRAPRVSPHDSGANPRYPSPLSLMSEKTVIKLLFVGPL